MRAPFLAALLLAPLPLAAQSGDPVTNLNLADAKAKNPALVAANHLSRAERALERALDLGRAEPRDAKVEKRLRNACEQAEREAGAALASDAGLIRAHVVRGQARLLLGENAGAREDCLQALGYLPADAEVLFCYGRASLLVGEGGQALSAYGRLRDEAGNPERAAQLLAEIQTWVGANPQGAKEKQVAAWLAQNTPR